MATLYDTSKRARKFILGFLVLTAVILVIQTITSVSTDCSVGNCSVQNALRYFMNPDRKFGEIARPTITGISLDSSTIPSYGLESVFSILTDVAYVYKVDKPREKLDTFEEAKNAVKLLGFNPLIYKTENTLFTWQTASDTKTIKYDKENLVWNMTTKYTENIEAKRIKVLDPKIELYENNAANLIENLGFDAPGLSNAKIDARYVKYNNGTFFSNSDPLQADYVIVNIYKQFPFADLKKQEELPTTSNKALIPKAQSAFVYTADPRVGEVRIVASNKLSNFSKDVFEISYTDFEYTVDQTSPNGLARGSYLLITPEEAWTKISNGQGSLVELITQGGNYFGDYSSSVSVKRFLADRSKTELGYYEPKDWTGYVYPIYIFRGVADMADGSKADFVYYMEAIKRVD